MLLGSSPVDDVNTGVTVPTVLMTTMTVPSLSRSACCVCRSCSMDQLAGTGAAGAGGGQVRVSKLQA